MNGGWSGVAKVSCILRHRGIQLILAYSWARPAILVAGKGRGGMFLFCFFTFIPVPLSSLSLSFISTISSSFLSFSGRRHKITHKGWRVVKPQHNAVEIWMRMGLMPMILRGLVGKEYLIMSLARQSSKFSMHSFILQDRPGLKVIKTFFMLISAEHKICPANKSQITNNCKTFSLNIAEHENFFADKLENSNYCWHFHIY